MSTFTPKLDKKLIKNMMDCEDDVFVVNLSYQVISWEIQQSSMFEADSLEAINQEGGFQTAYFIRKKTSKTTEEDESLVDKAAKLFRSGLVVPFSDFATAFKEKAFGIICGWDDKDRLAALSEKYSLVALPGVASVGVVSKDENHWAVLLSPHKVDTSSFVLDGEKITLARDLSCNVELEDNVETTVEVSDFSLVSYRYPVGENIGDIKDGQRLAVFPTPTVTDSNTIGVDWFARGAASLAECVLKVRVAGRTLDGPMCKYCFNLLLKSSGETCTACRIFIPLKQKTQKDDE